MGYIGERFGVPPEWFDPYAVGLSGKTYYLLARSSHVRAVETLRLEVPGFPFLRNVRGFLKPTGSFAQRIGKAATKNVLEVSELELSRLARRERLPVNGAVEDGYVLLRRGSLMVGCGLVIRGVLIGQLPRFIRAALRGGAWVAPGS